MKISWSNLRGGIQFFLLTFMLVCYLGYEYLEIPTALVSLGRMHPLFLHLPIGLFLGSVLIFYAQPKQTKTFHFLYHITVLVALVTAIAGLFLSKESGYDTDALALHRHTGVLLAAFLYLGGLISISHNNKVSHFILIGGTLLLIISSHLGAEITHGKNFLFPPTKEKSLVINCSETSPIYQTMIFPIIEQKCISCHNEGKSKGGLILTDSLAFLQGGENGSILNTESPAQSILLEVLSLPIEDERHMPPDGKTQLTTEEKELIRAWTLEGGNFAALVNEFSAYPIVEEQCQLINERNNQSPKYDFPAADPDLIEEIRTDYLYINPIAAGSPALSARFFVASAYSSESFQKLGKIKDQLVDLNVSYMPLEQKDWDLLTQLVNLEKLNINFTSFTSKQFNSLQNLPNLKILSINGKSADQQIGTDLGEFSALEELHLGFVRRSPEEIKEWQKKNPNVSIIAEFESDEILPLTAPIIKNNKNIYDIGDSIYLENKIDNTTIRYTLDGSLPDSLNGTIYQGPIPVESMINLKAIAVKEGWKKSPILHHSVFIKGIQPDSFALLTTPNKNYPGEGKNTFFNQKVADITPLRNNQWIAFRENEMVVELFFEEARPVESIAISYGADVPSYVFPPHKTTIYSCGEHKQWKKVSQTTHPSLTKEDSNLKQKGFYAFHTDKAKVNGIRIKMEGLPKIPSWHPGKGQKGWLFVDEVFLY